MSAQIDWDAVRRKPFADVETPTDWPSNVKPMSWDGTNLLGADGAGGLYWDGKKIKTEIKLSWGAKLIALVHPTRALRTASAYPSMMAPMR